MRTTKFMFILSLGIAILFVAMAFTLSHLNISSLSPSSNLTITHIGTALKNISSLLSSSPPTLSSPPSAPNSISASDVAKHGDSNSCWMIINGKVYDLTSFIGMHSGGSQQILQFCGQDGSVGFNTKDGNGSHRARDLGILNQFYIGDLAA